MLNVGSGDVTSDDTLFDSVASYDMGADVIAFILEDLNGDGDLDVAALNNDESQVTVRLGLGDGRFTRAAVYTTGENPVALATTRQSFWAAPDLVTANRIGDEDFVYLLQNTSEAPLRSDDCNHNRRPDECDIADDPNLDRDLNGIIDSCPSILPPERLPDG